MQTSRRRVIKSRHRSCRYFRRSSRGRAADLVRRRRRRRLLAVASLAAEGAKQGTRRLSRFGATFKSCRCRRRNKSIMIIQVGDANIDCRSARRCLQVAGNSASAKLDRLLPLCAAPATSCADSQTLSKQIRLINRSRFWYLLVRAQTDTRTQARVSR